jgi:hypothetical protein
MVKRIGEIAAKDLVWIQALEALAVFVDIVCRPP